MIRKLKNILTGWYYFLFKKKEIEQIALKRAEICVTCPLFGHGIYPTKDKRIPELSGAHCKECGCNLSAKLRVLDEECPEQKWTKQIL